MRTLLAFESSCDETAVALFRPNAAPDATNPSPRLFHTLHSQVALHALYGGVVPELASRDHVERIRALTDQVLFEAGATLADVDLFAYTAGPGLAGALMVAASFAQALAMAANKPVLPLHHLEGHLLSPLLAAETNSASPTFPYIALLVSGGHSQFYAVHQAGEYELLGESVDDAVGEVFDKSAKMMGLPYPGGQYLESMAADVAADAPALARPLPRPMLKSDDLMMSFSGLKTAVWHALREIPADEAAWRYPVVAREFQAAVVEVLIHKAMKACRQSNIPRLAICGGVAKNQVLRAGFLEACRAKQVELFFTPMAFCTDNAAMMALAASFHVHRAQAAGAFAVHPHWSLSDAVRPLHPHH